MQAERFSSASHRAGHGTALRWAALEIFTASFIVLFQELVLIRWLSTQVRVLAYFPNLVLIGAFLGLGIGAFRTGRRSLLWLWPASLLVLIGAALGMGRIAFTQESISEHLWLLYGDLPRDAPVIGSVQPPIILGFILSTIPFIPLGQIIAERLNIFREKSSALWGYCFNLLGSLLGVTAFPVVCFLGAFPWVWFAVFLACGLLFFASGKSARFVYPVAAVVIVLLVAQAERAERYSPYYALRADRFPDMAGFVVIANGSVHQYALDLEHGTPGADDFVRGAREGYHFPFRLLKKVPRRALVLGAGVGNDVAVLLDEGVERIDAVEIDPVILKLGKEHPDRPYDSSRVRTFTEDARSYLNSTEETYDLIVFGTLDSMTRLSALSNVRLDNFVYTRECMEAARSRLTPDGGMVLYFMVPSDFIRDRLFAMVASAFQDLPVVRQHYAYLFNYTLMAGPAFSHLKARGDGDPRTYFEKVLPTLQIPTDDWPFLYLRSKGISWFYLSLMSLFLALAGLGVFLASGEMRLAVFHTKAVDVEMFLFGAAFLLMETRFVTATNLLWGATWLTSAVVFGSVLLMVLLATIVMQLRPIPWWTAMSGLLLALLAAYLIPARSLLFHHSSVKLGATLLFVGIPIFFASACFALRFRAKERPDLAFGWNLIGSVAGGLLEFVSMATGFRAIVLLAMAFYLGIMLVNERRRVCA